MNVSIGDTPEPALFNKYRVTVGMVLVTKNQGVIIVQSAKASNLEWVLPQGGVDPGESFYRAFLREAKEELVGIELTGPFVYLGQYINPLPPEREKKDKVIFWFGAMVKEEPHNFNQSELVGMKTVHRADHLLTAICAARPEKQKMIVEVVDEMRRQGNLDWAEPVRLSKVA